MVFLMKIKNDQKEDITMNENFGQIRATDLSAMLFKGRLQFSLSLLTSLRLATLYSFQLMHKSLANDPNDESAQFYVMSGRHVNLVGLTCD